MLNHKQLKDANANVDAEPKYAWRLAIYSAMQPQDIET